MELLSGIFEGKTTGTPISLMVRNTSQISADYTEIAENYRPGHADYCFDAKYGFRDYRGGGRSSGRETIGRVAAGAIAAKILEQMGITVFAYTRSIGPVDADLTKFDRTTSRSTITAMPDAEADEKACAYLQQAREACDSVGGCMECLVEGLPAGIGDPVFEKLNANLAKAIMSIGAVKAVEIGDGAEASRHTGSENNDPFRVQNGHIVTETNNCGGILGGISSGMPITLNVAIKPTASIAKPQETVDLRRMENTTVTVGGRHDSCVVLRAAPAVEAAAALAVCRLLPADSDTLAGLRRQLDDVDEQMTALLARRLTLAGEIGRIKAAQGLPVLDEAREAAVLASRGDLLPQRRAQVERLFRLLMAESREEQERHG